jgi:hypothetical protein
MTSPDISFLHDLSEPACRNFLIRRQAIGDNSKNNRGSHVTDGFEEKKVDPDGHL